MEEFVYKVWNKVEGKYEHLGRYRGIERKYSRKSHATQSIQANARWGHYDDYEVHKFRLERVEE